MNAKEAKEQSTKNRVKLVENEYLDVKLRVQNSVKAGFFHTVIERRLYTETEERLRTEGFTIKDTYQDEEYCVKILWE